METTYRTGRFYSISGKPPDNLDRLASKCGAMLRCLNLARIAAYSTASVLITGETGVGKSLLAKLIHFDSEKSGLPCVTLRCAQMRGQDLRTVLLGDRRNPDGKPGLIEQASGGTLLIDGVDQLPSFMQPQLLDLLKSQSGDATLGVRLISTSDNALSRKAASGIFVENLVYRLGEITIRVPPLRERGEDIDDLVANAVKTANRSLGKTVKGLSRTAQDFVHHYHFPGNIRELFMIVRHAVCTIDRDVIHVEDLGLEGIRSDPRLISDNTVIPLGEMEKRHIHRALLHTGWKKQAAARLLRISTTMLDRKIRLYRLERGGSAPEE